MKGNTRYLFCGLVVVGMMCCALPQSFAQSVEDDTAYVQAFVGVGAPELLHASVGYLIVPNTALEVTMHAIIFNPLVGLGFTTYLLGEHTTRPPRHSLLGSAHLALNVSQPGLRGGGEVIKSGALIQSGYGFVADNGFSVRLKAGVLVYFEQASLAAGPLFGFALGWTL